MGLDGTSTAPADDPSQPLEHIRYPIGWLGTGFMGGAMAARLLTGGQQLVVWNRTREKTATLAAAGARVAATPAEVSSRCPLIMLCLTADAVERVVFGPDGLATAAASTQLVVDHTTMHPDLARRLAARWRAQTGGAWVDAPVTGGVLAAEAGRLTVFAGGDRADVDQASKHLDAYAKCCHYTGPSGCGQAVKLCNQVIVGATIWSLAEATTLAGAAGIDPAMLPGWLRDCPVDSGLLQMMQPLMAAGVRKTGWLSMTRVVDDLQAALDLARTAGAPLPLTASVAQLLHIATLWTPPDELCRFADLLSGPTTTKG